MTFDQAQSPRIGQKTPVESTYVRMFAGTEIPEAAWPGQIIYRTDTQGLQVYNGVAWEDVVGGVAGILTYVGPDIPVAHGFGDIWFDTDDGYKMYVARSAGANENKIGEWELAQDSAAALAAANAAQDTADASVKSYVTEYSVNSSETVAPTTGWSTATPTRAPGTFVWVRTTVTHNDGSTAVSNPVLVTGNTGATGSPGIPGTPGSDGVTYYTWLKYASSPTPTAGDMSDFPTGKTYMGIAVGKTSATESNVYTDYSWSLIQGPQGIPGAVWYTSEQYANPTDIPNIHVGDFFIYMDSGDVFRYKGPNNDWDGWAYDGNISGDQGVPGPPGEDGQPTYTWIKYGTSSTGAGLSDDPTGKTYIGFAYNKTTPTESTVATDYEWSLIQGPPGSTGSNGISVTAVTPYFAQVAYGAGAPAAPVVATPLAPWVTTEPAYAVDTELYRTEKITYSNATFSYTAVSKVSSYTAATTAYAAATPDANPPASSPTPVVTGSISSLAIKWPAILNHDPVTYEVHCSPTSATFTPVAGTLQAETTACSHTINEKLADGTFLVKDGSVTYYVRIVAKDLKIGGGFNSAAPGTAGSGVLRKITDTDISEGYIYANAIDSLQIHGSKIDADLVVSGKMKTAESGQRMELSNDGLRQFGADGVSLRVDLPNDPQKSSLIDANLIARGLTISQGMEVRGNSTFAMGSKSILQTTTVGATSGPSLGTDYPLSSFARGQWCDPHYNFSLDSAESSGSWRCANMFFNDAVMHHGDGYYRSPQIASSTGDTRGQYSWFTGTVIAVGGAERHVTAGDFRLPGYVAASTEKYMITSWDDSGLVSAGTIAPIKKAERQDGTFSWFWQWRLGRCFSATGNTRAHMVAQAKRNMFSPWPAGNIELSTLTFTDTTITPSAVKTIASSFFAQDENLMGVNYGSSQRMGFQGADRDIWVFHGSVNNYVFSDAASPVRLPELEFPAIPAMRSIAACGDVLTGAFTRFTVAPATDGPQYYNHTPITWAATDSPIWWGAFTWNDSVGAGHETNASVVSSITMKKRARLTVTVPDLPDPAAGKGTTRDVDDVNSFRFYLTRKPTAPLRTELIKQNQQPNDLATVLLVDQPIFVAGTPPPVDTNFPAQSSASIESNASGTGGIPKIKLTGDGFAHVEDLDIGKSVNMAPQGYSSFSPTGVVQAYAGLAAPQGWLICDGQLLYITAYPGLYAVIGQAYVGGDGSTTFALPNLKGRSPMGLDSSVTEFNALGKAGGERAHLLTTAEMPSHQHTGGTSANGTHAHLTRTWGSTYGYVSGTVAVTRHTASGASSTYDMPSDTEPNHAHSFTTAGAGGDNAHNNLQPYLSMNYIIKI